MPPTDFTELDTLRDTDGLLIGRITYKKDVTGERRFSFAVLREVSQGEAVGATHWMRRRHIPAIRRLLDQLEERLVSEEERARVDVIRKVG